MASISLCVIACEGKEVPAPARRPSVTAASAQSPAVGRFEEAAEPRAKPSSPPFVGTAGIVDKTVPTGVAELVSVRTGRHEGFVRVVFEFKPGMFPGYHLEYIDRPVRKCGSGEVTPLEGDAWLAVRLSPARAHDEQGRASVPPRERREEVGVIRELELTCDFEAVVTWVIGLASPNRYRVLELSGPPRLAVDILSP